MAQLLQTQTGYLKGCHGAVITALQADGSAALTPVRHALTTPQSVGCDMNIVEGEESTLRGGDKILTTVKEQNIYTSGTLTFVDAKFDAKLLEIIDGGSIIEVVEGTDTRITGYRAATKAQQYARLPFNLEVYIENYNSQGSLDGYIKYTFVYGKGIASNIAHEDQSWSTPEFSVRVEENPQLSQGMYDKEFVAALPVVLAA
jgi:hypothetical protein